MDTHHTDVCIPLGIPLGRPSIPGTDCTYLTTWVSKDACDEQRSTSAYSNNSDKENCPPQLSDKVEPCSMQPSTRSTSSASSISSGWDESIQREDTTFHLKQGILYTNFVNWYAISKNSNALTSTIFNENTQQSAILSGILQGLICAIPKEHEHLTLLRALDNTERDLSYLCDASLHTWWTCSAISWQNI